MITHYTNLVCKIVTRKAKIWSHKKPKFRFLAALRKKPMFKVFGICLYSTTKMLTHGTVTAVDSLVLFQTNGMYFVVNFNSAFIVIS